MLKFENVFVVDDDPSFVFLYKEIFSEYDFYDKMMTFSNLDDLMLVLKNEGKFKETNLLITDLNLINVDAIDYLHKASTLHPHLFHTTDIIISSCSNHPKDITRANDSGLIRFFMEKPIVVEQLLSELDKAKAA